MADIIIDESNAWRATLVAGCAVLITRKCDGRDVLLQGDDADKWRKDHDTAMDMPHPHSILMDAVCDEFFDY